MAEIYIHGVRVNKFSRRTRKIMKLAVSAVAVLAAVAVYINSSGSGTAYQPTTNASTQSIAAATNTTIAPYFKFQDSGKWVLSKNDSTSSKFLYIKYHGSQAQDLLYVYVNQVPIPLNLATDYVLPVRIVNENSLDVTSVSGPCGRAYGGMPAKVKELTIGQATMLCDPSDAEYSIQLAQVGGDYQINMQRPNGRSIQFVIIYKDVTSDPRPDALINIANSFKAL